MTVSDQEQTTPAQWQSAFQPSVHILTSHEQNNTQQKGHMMTRELSHWQVLLFLLYYTHPPLSLAFVSVPRWRNGHMRFRS